MGVEKDTIRLTEIKKIKTQAGILPDYERIPGVDRITIAIIDNGFAGLEDPNQEYLPNLQVMDEANATPAAILASHAQSILVPSFSPEWLKTHPELGGTTQDPMVDTGHGKIMAVIGRSLSEARQILLPGSVPRAFCRSIQMAADLGVNAIVHSKVFETDGNFETPDGPLEQCLEIAARKGILVFNAAGNFAGKVYAGPATEAVSKTLRLKSNFRNNIQITLNWNQWGSSFDNSGTDLDFDLILKEEDPERPGQFIEVARSAYNQRNIPQKEIDELNKTSTTEKFRRLPFEKLPTNAQDKITLKAGKNYWIEVRQKDHSVQLTDSDRVYVSVYSDTPPQRDTETMRDLDAFEFLDATPGQDMLETAMSKYVISVGANHPASASAPGLPHIVMPIYTAQLNDTMRSEGSSEANAFLGLGIYPYLQAAANAVDKKLTKADLLSFVTKKHVTSREIRAARGQWTPHSLESSALQIRAASLEKAPVLRKIYTLVRDRSKGEVKLWKIEDEGRYLITTTESPTTTGLFPFSFPKKVSADKHDAYEYYISMARGGDLRQGYSRAYCKTFTYDRLDLVTFARQRFNRADGTSDPYPWEDIAGEASQYVEVRHDPVAIENAEGRDLAMWSTPTLEKLFTRLGVPNAQSVADKY